MMITASAVAVIAASAAAAAAPAFAAQHVEHALYLIFCGIAVFRYFAHEIQGFSRQRMVEVYGYGVFFYFGYGTVETRSVGIHQRYDAAGVDVFLVEVSVYLEHVFAHLYHTFLLILAVCFFYGQREVELFSFLQRLDV